MTTAEMLKSKLHHYADGYTGPRTIDELNALFDACFRLKREASEAAGRDIPLVAAKFSHEVVAARAERSASK